MPARRLRQAEGAEQHAIAASRPHRGHGFTVRELVPVHSEPRLSPLTHEHRAHLLMSASGSCTRCWACNVAARMCAAVTFVDRFRCAPRGRCKHTRSRSPLQRRPPRSPFAFCDAHGPDPSRSHASHGPCKALSHGAYMNPAKYSAIGCSRWLCDRIVLLLPEPLRAPLPSAFERIQHHAGCEPAARCS